MGTPAPALWAPNRANTLLAEPLVIKSAFSQGTLVSFSSVVTARNKKASAVLQKWDEGFHRFSVYFYLFNF